MRCTPSHILCHVKLGSHHRNPDRNLSCLLANVRSISKNKNDFIFSLAEHRYDVVALTETWLDGKTESTPLPGEWASQYDFFRCDRKAKKGGGVALLVRKTLCPDLVFCKSVLNSYELLCCDIGTLSAMLRLVVVYKAPSCPAPKVEQMCKALSDVCASNRACVVVGDFNMPDINWNCLPNPSLMCATSRSFLDTCSSLGLTQHVKTCTLGNNILDLVFSSVPGLVNDVRVKPPIGSSDHSSIQFQIYFLVSDTSSKVIKRDYRNADFDAITTYLSNVDWLGSFNNVETVDGKYELFLAVLHHTIDMFVPTIKASVYRQRLPSHLRNLASKRATAWDTANSTGKSEDWLCFRHLSNIFEKRLWKYNSNMEKKIVQSADKGAFFRLLNSKLNSKPNIGVLKSTEGVIARTDKDKAEMLANTFEQSFMQHSSLANRCSDGISVFPCMLDSVWFYAEDIYKLLIAWPSSYSVTPDHVPLFFIKKVAHIIAGPLEHLFNLSFLRSEVPSRWRTSLITPIPKKKSQAIPQTTTALSVLPRFLLGFLKNFSRRGLCNIWSGMTSFPQINMGFKRVNQRPLPCCNPLMIGLLTWMKEVAPM